MEITREKADKYQGLFNYLNDQYGINPTIEGMNDLIAEVDKAKQLILSSVSQQSELLAFKHWFNELPEDSDDRLYITKETISRFKANCG